MERIIIKENKKENLLIAEVINDKGVCIYTSSPISSKDPHFYNFTLDEVIVAFPGILSCLIPDIQLDSGYWRKKERYSKIS